MQIRPYEPADEPTVISLWEQCSATTSAARPRAADDGRSRTTAPRRGLPQDQPASSLDKHRGDRVLPPIGLYGGRGREHGQATYGRRRGAQCWRRQRLRRRDRRNLVGLTCPIESRHMVTNSAWHPRFFPNRCGMTGEHCHRPLDDWLRASFARSIRLAAIICDAASFADICPEK